MARTFAPERPALRSVAVRSFSMTSGVGGRPFFPSAFTRPKIVVAAFREIDW